MFRCILVAILANFVFNKDHDYILPRPPLYFGLQTQSENPIYFGLVWNNYDDQRGGFIHLREAALYSDFTNAKVIRADGLTFAKTTVYDNLNRRYRLNSTYVKVPGHNDAFAYKIQGESLDLEGLDINVSVYLYVSVSEPDGIVQPIITENDVKIMGSTSEFGSFRLLSLGNTEKTYYFGNRTDESYSGSDAILPVLKAGSPVEESPACCFPLNHDSLLPNEVYSDRTNIIVLQRVLKTPFEWSVVFENIDDPISTSIIQRPIDIDRMYEQLESNFTDRFMSIFPVTKFLDEHSNQDPPNSDWIEFAKQTLSSLLFGLSYFSGTGLAHDQSTDKTWELPNRKLLTFIPAKIGFPRGFYWDEAFHQMLIIRWDRYLAQRIAMDWHTSSISNQTTGWIAREQILGAESRSRAPSWAWPGQVNQMNPPVYFMTMQQYLHLNGEAAVHFFKSFMYERLQKTYDWYMRNCVSKTTNYTFVWNGRVGDSSLDSGLDDFPRCHKFAEGEINVDLQSWMAKISSIMSEIATAIGDNKMAEKYIQDHKNIMKKLNEKLWNDKLGFYVDYSPNCGDIHVGFPGMLPLCLAIETNTTRLQQMIKRMGDRRDLLDDNGWLSLSQTDSKFSARGNYWRGNLWVNQQYLCSQGLYYYEKQFAKSDPLLSCAITDLRKTVQKSFMKMMFDNYYLHDSTRGGIYETYHPFNGRGYNNLPFTGWSVLGILMMAEEYQ